MKNMYYIWGMIFGIIFGISIVIATLLIKKAHKKERFDERQMLARLRGFKLGFFTILIYDSIYAFYSLFVEKTILTTFAAMVIGIVLGAAVFGVYVIWKDAYVALDEGRKNFLLLFGACGILNLLNGIRGIREEMALAEGDPQIYVLNFSAALLSGAVFIAFAIKGLTRKKEEEE